MFPSFFVLRFFGLTQILYSLAISCPPKGSDGGAETVKFCSDSEVTSSDIYIDSSDASTRITNCTCNFNVSVQTFVKMNTTSSHYRNCITKLKYGDKSSEMFDICSNFNVEIDMLTSQTYELVLINGEINLKNYCLHLFTGNKVKINLKCFPDFYIGTTSTTSANVTSTLLATSVKIFGTTRMRSTFNNEKQGFPLYILGPVVGGSIIVVIIVLIIAIVCIRRKRKHSYEKSSPKTDPLNTANQVFVHDTNDNGDEMRDNDLNHSIDIHPQIEELSGGYAEIRSIDIKLQNNSVDVGGGYAVVQSPTEASTYKTTSTSIEGDKTMYTKDLYRHRSHGQSGDVYSKPVKKKNQQKQVVGAGYAMVDKKNKNKNTKIDRKGVSKPAIKEKPVPTQSKPVVISSGDVVGRGSLNEDELHYSEIELHDSRNTSNFKISEKSGYAEIL